MLAGEAAQELLTQAGYRGFLTCPSPPGLLPLAEVERGHFGDFLFVRPGLDLP
jgi:hypothetical protein